ncbi:glutamate cyclase domain-containing protein [Bifidobacterium crudilactis]|uniref:glutamate cyclase domain-containing protein n=1 Tax=Bifidobacterium crudilactis TaxID=327277 RepID=UPI002352F249|nr:glutamate cyclase domain-containing protein [Bifidobacterium crudilactis]MCI1217647.1 DUF4392 domain-containing protein [Bifidobacterium crudilactis]
MSQQYTPTPPSAKPLAQRLTPRQCSTLKQRLTPTQWLTSRIRTALQRRAISRIEAEAAHDVGRGSESLAVLTYGELFAAARFLASNPQTKAFVVTGFYVPSAVQPAAETDGPVGALELCAALRAIGGDAWLVSDTPCEGVLRPSATTVLPDNHVLIAPVDEAFETWLQDIMELIRIEHIDTVIFVERAGPSYGGLPRNMRAACIKDWTAPLSRLTGLGLHSIGIGDGGNEIGMGKILAEDMQRLVRYGDEIGCSVSTDELIIGGTSNWAAHALVGALRVLGHKQVEHLLEDSWHHEVLSALVAEGSIDGVTHDNVPSVDGLRGDDYLGTIRSISRIAQSHNW